MRASAATNFPSTLHLSDDGRFPNSRFPVLVYEGVVEPSQPDAAVAFETLFADHGWTPCWRNGVYARHHYHSTAHEVLGVFRGSARVQLGGDNGLVVALKVGDVLVLPAGVAHRRIEASADFGCVGAYPEGTAPDTLYGKPGERPAADRNLETVALPAADPVEGKSGPLASMWASAQPQR